MLQLRVILQKKSLPTYDSVILLFTNPGGGDKACLKTVCVCVFGGGGVVMHNPAYVYFTKGDDYLFGDAIHKIP